MGSTADADTLQVAWLAVAYTYGEARSAPPPLYLVGGAPLHSSLIPSGWEAPLTLIPCRWLWLAVAYTYGVGTLGSASLIPCRWRIAPFVADTLRVGSTADAITLPVAWLAVAYTYGVGAVGTASLKPCRWRTAPFVADTLRVGSTADAITLQVAIYVFYADCEPLYLCIVENSFLVPINSFL